jgi:two-component system, OmpR family, response regulator CpxR
MRPLHRILVVEDDRALRDTIADILSDEGFEVACASNGREALDQLAREQPPDLIVLDLVMPVMDGWAFRAAQRLRPELARIPTVVLSASFPADNPRIRDLQAEAVLSKPVGIDRLIGAVCGVTVPRPALAH